MIPSTSGLTSSSTHRALRSPRSSLPITRRIVQSPTDPLLSTPVYPSFLEHTRYPDLCLDRRNTSRIALPNHTFHGRDGSAVDTNLRLPSVFSTNDKSQHIEVRADGLGLSYIGPGKTESHAASVRTDQPMRGQCGIYYFEITILSKGDDGYIGIGFCRRDNKLERLPGWDKWSWGYHGDDGHSFAGSGTGKVYGPRFTTGDVIGCGVNFATQSAFYTKNGTFLGIAFQDIDVSHPLYPSIGLRTPGEKVSGNFGTEQYVFDIVQYIKEQKHMLWGTITNRPQDASELDHLVMSYLVHHGYTSTAKAVASEAKCVNGTLLTTPSCQKEKDMEERQRIRNALLLGDIDLAIELTQHYFPGILEGSDQSKEVLFELKCRKFIELVRDASLKSSPETHVNSLANQSGRSDGHGDADNCGRKAHSATEIPDSEWPPSQVNTAASTAEDRPNGHRLTELLSSSMEVDSEEPILGASAASDLEGDDVPASTMMMRQAIQYGLAIQEEYGSHSDANRRDHLVEVFSLLAYPDPIASPVAHLMDVAGRDTLAAKLNGVILLSRQLPDTPGLERVYRQAMTANNQLADHGNGTASLIDIAEKCAIPRPFANC